MCGICGIWNRAGDTPGDERLAAMMVQLRHRGPDGQGSWHGGSIYFGHRRLRILDPSPLGDQPMHSSDGRYTLLFNGEIHNYLQLRRELARSGVRFQTQTDTEVVAAAWSRWGAECLRRFNGMWALALWDSASHELYLSRDRFGIKPLYWLQAGEEIGFASEIKALLAAFPEQRRANRREIFHFLTGGVPDSSDATFFADVRSVSPATLLRIGRNHQLSSRYWGAADSLDRPASRQPDEELLELLDDAVRLRLASDRPLGTTLSGGLDSSTISALAATHSHGPLPTFALRYPGRTIDESAHATAVLERWPQLCVNWVEPTPDCLLEEIERIVWHHDAPTPMRGRLPAWILARQAGSQVRVLLDGSGGDELLAGYPRFLVPASLDLARHPISSGASIEAISALRRAWSHHAPTKYDVLRPLVLRAAALLRRTGPNHSGVLRRQFRREAGPGDWERNFHGWLRREMNGPFPTYLKNALWHELTCAGLPEALHNVDATTMAHSIEGRPPLLDHRVVEFCFALPQQAYFETGWSKGILRRATRHLLPDTVRWRRTKLGFPSPIGEWMRDPVTAGEIQARLTASELVCEAVEPSHLRAMFDPTRRAEPKPGRFRQSPEFVWRLLTLALWEGSFLGADLRPPS